MRKWTVVAALFFFSLAPLSQARAADRVVDGSVVHLVYFFEANGAPVVNAAKKDTMQLVVGQNRFPAAFEKQLIGLKAGDRKDIRLTPDQAYGPVREDLIKRIPISEVPPSIPLKEGMLLRGKKGERPIRVAKVLEDSVVLDENHPFAGKTLDYHVEITDVK